MVNDEQGLIGCILTDPSYGMNKVYNRVKPDMLTNEFYRDAYSCLLNLYDKGETITVVEVARLLEDSHREKTEIIPLLTNCVVSVATVEEIKGYAKSIETEYRARRVRLMLEKAVLDPKDIDDSITDLLSELEGLKAKDYREIKTLAEISITERGNYFNDRVGENSIKTGFRQIDDCIGGLEGGEMFVIGARPAVGKSAFATQMLCNIAERGLKVGYFNLEMSDKQIYERVVSRYSGIELTRIKRSKAFIGDEENLFRSANERIERLSGLTVISGSQRISEIKAESRHRGFDLIVIDYLQLIGSDRFYDNRASEVGEISKQLKGLAMEMKIPVIALSQMNRKIRSTDEPTMAELRESGNVEQDASIIGLMWNLNEEGNLKGFKIDKNRQGTTFKETMKFEGSKMQFVETEIDVEQVQEFDDAMEIPW